MMIVLDIQPHGAVQDLLPGTKDFPNPRSMLQQLEDMGFEVRGIFVIRV